MSSRPPSSIPHRVFRSVASNYVGEAAAVVTGVVLTPFILRRLGVEHFGLWALATGLVSYGAVLDLGISGAVVKYVAEHGARGELGRARGLVATALRLYTALGILAVALSGVVAAVLPRVVHLSAEHRQLALWLILLSGFGLGVAIPCGTALSVLRGLQRFDLVNLLAVPGILLTGAGTVVVLLLGGDVLGMVGVGIATTTAMQVPAVWLVRKLAPELRFGWRGGSIGLARTVFSFSSSVAVVQLAGILTVKLDTAVVGGARGVAAVTPYALAQRLAQLVELVTKQFLKVILPLATEIGARNDRESLRSLFLSGTRLTLAASLPVAIGLAVLSPQILTLWVGADYARYSDLVVILAAHGMIDTMLWPGVMVLMAIERHRPLAWMALGNGIANLGLSLVLVRPFGLMGVAVGTVVPASLEAFLLVIPYAMRTIGVSPGTVVKQVYLPVALPALLLAAVLGAARKTADTSSVGALVAITVSGAIVYVSAYVAVGASSAERTFYRSLPGSVRRVASTAFRRP